MKPFKEIPRVKSISKSAFIEKYVSKNRPVIIENLTEDWQALKKWNFKYLKENFPDVEVATIPVKDKQCDVSLEYGAIISYKKLSEAINIINGSSPYDSLAIAASETDFPKEIKDDYSIHKLNTNVKFPRTRFFISANETVTALHQDLFENLYTMVKGSKRIFLFAPKEKVYPYSRFSKLPNHANVNPENINYKKFPLMKTAQAFVVDLKAGDTLYMPSMWWHYLRALDDNIAISQWWANSWKIPIVWAAFKYKELRGI